MMKYPALVIDEKKLKENIINIQKICSEADVEVCAVTKCICAIPEITQLYVEAGITNLADSRLQNLRKMPFSHVKKWLLRIPMIWEAAEVVMVSDISLNSEIKTMERLSEEALKIGERHGVILMVDLGDLREGVLLEHTLELASRCLSLRGIELLGVGTNLNCYGGIIPTADNLSELVAVAEKIEAQYNIVLPIISGGNSGSMHLITGKTLPKRINNLRLGEVILLGCETSYQQKLANMHTDVFRLDTQIVELQEKPSLPIGESGLNAFGEKVVYTDKGMMKRAIVACGRQDVAMEKILPLDSQIEIIGSSSDHMILDVTNTDKNYEVGDVVSFSVCYASLLSLCTSEYVYKVIY